MWTVLGITTILALSVAECNSWPRATDEYGVDTDKSCHESGATFSSLHASMRCDEPIVAISASRAVLPVATSSTL
eukprot:COSAG02_NODE_16280_length_1096_cov_2.094283_2_plen_75_part_00